MNIQGLQATYRRLLNESPVWKLLRADNVPHILAFIADIFTEANEVPYARAKILLDEFIKSSREQGLWPTERNAAAYLNEWIASGWLREIDDLLSKTDASDKVLRFCRGLNEPSSGTTASHLRIVQDAVRDFVIAMSAAADERIALLEQQKQALQNEIDELHAGIVRQLDETRQRERIREIYQLASLLTGDFRRVEDEIRQIDKDLRIEMIEGESSRGKILLSLMEKESILSKSDAGNAFDGFCELLQHHDRSAEFREQLNSILNYPAAQHLNEYQRKYLGKLTRELSLESERVFQVRRRTEEGLRSYIESGATLENRHIEHLLSQLEKQAIVLREQQADFRLELNADLGLGSVQIFSLDSWQLKYPDEHMDTRGIVENLNNKEASQAMLQCLNSVQVVDVARKIKESLIQSEAMSLGALISLHPIYLGLEELVAFLRVAKAVKANQLDQQHEQIAFQDKNGVCLQARIPKFYLTSTLFPENLDELAF